MMQRVRIPDPMAHMWAVLLSGGTPEAKTAFLDSSCPSSAYDEKDGLFLCTRRYRHTGRHAASDGDYIIAVWE